MALEQPEQKVGTFGFNRKTFAFIMSVLAIAGSVAGGVYTYLTQGGPEWVSKGVSLITPEVAVFLVPGILILLGVIGIIFTAMRFFPAEVDSSLISATPAHVEQNLAGGLSPHLVSTPVILPVTKAEERNSTDTTDEDVYFLRYEFPKEVKEVELREFAERIPKEENLHFEGTAGYYALNFTAPEIICDGERSFIQFRQFRQGEEFGAGYYRALDQWEQIKMLRQPRSFPGVFLEETQATCAITVSFGEAQEARVYVCKENCPALSSEISLGMSA